jgi:intracellular septation protein A
MNESGVLLGILPLILFAIIDSFGGLKTALITAAVLAIAELLFSYFYFGEFDFITVTSVALILIMAAAAYTKKSSKFFKMQPVILSFVLGAIFLIAYLMGHELIYEMWEKYKVALPDATKEKFSHPFYVYMMKSYSFHIFWGLWLHACLCYFAAIKFNNFWWITTRVVGFYVCQFIPMMFCTLRIKEFM